MSASYNWKYQSGTLLNDPILNRLGINGSIPVTADNIKPNGFCYVALFGNDATGNGSRLYPFRTIAKSISLGFAVIIMASGVYREAALQTAACLLGDGDVIIDGTLINHYVFSGIGGYDARSYNISFRGFTGFKEGDDYANTHGNSVFDGLSPGGMSYNGFRGTHILTNCILKNSLLWFDGGSLGDNLRLRNIENCTFYRTNAIFRTSTFNELNAVNNCIFYQCNIHFGSVPDYIDYSLFFQCNFKFEEQTAIPDFTRLTYPSVPEGYTYYDNAVDLRTAAINAFGGNPLVHCDLADPLFNNVSIGDYTLQFNSPAKNLSYFGTYVGAKSIAQSIKVSGTEGTGGFELSSAVNLTVTNDSITLSNPALDGQIDTRVIVNLLGRELADFPSYGFNADRNGQYIDSIADLATTTQAAGATLLAPVPYSVETGAITYNGVVYQAGERFTTVASQTTFTTTASGVVREILEAPQRHTILARFSDGGAAVAADSALVSGYWYFVQSGSVTYNGVAYTAGQAFKAIDTHAFSGSGNVITAISTENYQHYELGSKPTSNNTGDQRTGVIIRGNGDPAYERGILGIKEFSISAKFIQVRYIIRVSNLKG
ncbi:MAG: hypothetical protein JWR38_5239 [Mucilaginibacter sp.]|nr:hypothetical protein [Mucilaginibacter sp.]